MKKRSLALLLAIMLVFGAAIIPQKKADAKSKCWYGKSFETAKEAKKCIKFKGSNKIQIKGKWTHTVKRTTYSSKKAKKFNKTFKLTKSTKYYLNNDPTSGKYKKVSKKTFKKWAHTDLSFTTIKIRYGKVVKAYVDVN